MTNNTFITIQQSSTAILAQPCEPSKFPALQLSIALYIVKLQDSQAGLLPSLYYQMLSTMLFFGDHTVFPLSLSRVKNPQPLPQVITNPTTWVHTARFSFCRWPVQTWSGFVKSLLLMSDGSLERQKGK